MHIDDDELITESISEHDEIDSYEEERKAKKKKSRKKRVLNKLKAINVLQSLSKDREDKKEEKEDKKEERDREESNQHNPSIPEVKITEFSIISKEEDSFRSDSKFSGNKSSILPEGVEDSKSSKKTMLRKQGDYDRKFPSKMKMSSPLNKSAKQKKNKNNVAEKFVNFCKKREDFQLSKEAKNRVIKDLEGSGAEDGMDEDIAKIQIQVYVGGKTKNPKDDILMRKFDRSCYLDFTNFFLRKQYCLESTITDWKSKDPNVMEEIKDINKRYIAFDKAYEKFCNFLLIKRTCFKTSDFDSKVEKSISSIKSFIMKNAKYYPLLNSKNIEESKAVVNNDNDAMFLENVSDKLKFDALPEKLK